MANLILTQSINICTAIAALYEPPLLKECHEYCSQNI